MFYNLNVIVYFTVIAFLMPLSPIYSPSFLPEIYLNI